MGPIFLSWTLEKQLDCSMPPHSFSKFFVSRTTAETLHTRLCTCTTPPTPLLLNNRHAYSLPQWEIFLPLLCWPGHQRECRVFFGLVFWWPRPSALMQMCVFQHKGWIVAADCHHHTPDTLPLSIWALQVLSCAKSDQNLCYGQNDSVTSHRKNIYSSYYTPWNTWT